jgi:hypothetical protein
VEKGSSSVLLGSGSSLKGTDERDQVLDLDWGEQILPCCHSLRYASSGNALSDDSIKLGVGSSLNKQRVGESRRGGIQDAGESSIALSV